MGWWSSIKRAIHRVGKAISKTVKSIIKNPLPTIVAIAGQAIGIPAPVTMAAMTAAQGGKLEDIAKSAVLAYVAPQATSVISNAIAPTVSSVITNEAAAAAITNATSKALVNGSIAAAAGRDFAEAATGTLTGSLIASGYQNAVAPSAIAQVEKLGLSVDNSKLASNVLGSALASGTAEAAKGNDFAAGFESSLMGSALDTATKKLEYFAGDTIKSIGQGIQSVAGVEVDKKTANGIPDELVAQVPESTEGKVAQEKSTSLEDQLAQISQMEKPAEYGQKFGSDLATNETKVYLTPSDGDLTKYDFVNRIPASVMTSPDGELTPVEVTGKAITDEDLKKAAITGDTNLLKELTEFGQLPAGGETTASQPTEDLFKTNFQDYLSQINSKADQSEANAIDAKVQAMINPTPENIAAAQDAALAAELDKKTVNEAMSGNVPPSVVGAPESTSTETSDVLANRELQKYLEQMGLPVDLTGSGTTGGSDLLTQPVDTAGETPSSGTDSSGSLGGLGGLGGIDTTPTELAGEGTSTGEGYYGEPDTGVPGDGTGTIGDGTDGSGSGQSTSGLGQLPGTTTTNPAPGGLPSGGGGSGTAPRRLYTTTTTSYPDSAAPTIDQGSYIYMSPQEYAARTQLSNLFRVARGGLITLKNLR